MGLGRGYSHAIAWRAIFVRHLDKLQIRSIFEARVSKAAGALFEHINARLRLFLGDHGSKDTHSHHSSTYFLGS